MAAPVTVTDACKIVYEEIWNEKKHRYAIFFIKDGVHIDVEVIGTRDQDYEDFLANLQAGGDLECRYGLFDFDTTNLSKKQKLFLICWCPDTTVVNRKMLYWNSFQTLRESLVDVHVSVIVTDWSQASKEAAEELLR